MKGFSSGVRTDLAAERYSALETDYAKEHAGLPDGIDFSESEECGIRKETVRITTAAGAERFGKPIGTYETYYTGDLGLLGERETDAAVGFLARGIRRIADTLCHSVSAVLLIGLGNRHITSDAIGAFTADRVAVTRHLLGEGAEVFSDGDECVSTSVFTPGVVGQTGIETLELCRGAVERTRPDLVLLVDALAARGTERLGKTVQICSGGIRPGGGIGNRRCAIDRETLGVPTMTVGVPTVIGTGTLLCDALERAEAAAGVLSDAQREALWQAVDAGDGLFVSPKDTDTVVRTYARLISRAVNRAFLGTDDFPTVL